MIVNVDDVDVALDASHAFTTTSPGTFCLNINTSVAVINNLQPSVRLVLSHCSKTAKIKIMAQL